MSINSKEHILLISPYNINGGSESINFPMGLLSLGSALLSQGYAVTVLDGAAISKKQYKAKLTQIIEAGNVLFVGISAMTTQLPIAVETAQMIRRKRFDIPLVWGGVHPTLFPEETARDELVDLVVIGEADESILEIASVISKKDNCYDKIPGIVFKDPAGHCVFTGKRMPPNLDNLVFPKYDELFDVERYINRSWVTPEQPGKASQVRMIDVHTGVGCPHRCKFCINTVVYRGGEYYPHSPYRAKSAERILDEIQQAIDKYGINYVNIIDENFFVNNKRLIEFMDGIAKRQMKIYWYASVRADYFGDRYLDQTMIERLKESGCFMLGTGAESGSQKILDFLKKDYKLKQVLHEAEVLNRNKIYAQFSFMVGLPGETVEDMAATIDMIDNLGKIGPYVQVQNPALYRPLPGGELFEECLKRGFNGPVGIRGWKSNEIDQEGGIKAKYIPWLANDKKIMYYMRYSREIALDLSPQAFGWWWKKGRIRFIDIKNYIINIMRLIYRFRKRTDMWSFQVEWRLYDALKIFKVLLKKRK